MGIADRHYVRDTPRSSGGLRGRGGVLPMWSVNTWLIAICVAIFVIDGFLPQRYFAAGPPTLFDGVTSIPETAVVEDTPQRAPVTIRDSQGKLRTQVMLVRPIFAGTQGPQIGWQPVFVMRTLESWLHFSSYELVYHVGFWRLLGFQFLHANLTHLLFNMIGLFFFGPMVEQYLGSKRYLAFYLLCGICGALMYGLLNLGGAVASLMLGSDVALPGLLFNDMATPLLGASAGVFGVLMAGAFLAPSATVLVFFILPMKLRTLAYVLVGLALLTVLTGGNNAGGEAGHLGGALAGYYFIRRPRRLHNFFDVLGWADPTSRHYREPRGRVRGGPEAGEVDRVLDKVHAQGLKSLTDREKRILREASERDG
ncbi:MAG: rhomboid family intramembrane serine protease [Phycisphaerales bacterium]|nr:rhomboid family intramembrane serine protease [Phycisphaerae bacterium]NNF44642.1 rhomboid family intramembrane serine protease [Phycisphaerales bacterium]NNM27258.1 rhomboid family intramembrane serine protease [Phycisphaerales bacterium]